MSTVTVSNVSYEVIDCYCGGEPDVRGPVGGFDDCSPLVSCRKCGLQMNGGYTDGTGATVRKWNDLQEKL